MSLPEQYNLTDHKTHYAFFPLSSCLIPEIPSIKNSKKIMSCQANWLFLFFLFFYFGIILIVLTRDCS